VTLSIIPVTGIGEVSPGTDLPALLEEALRPVALVDGDVVVVTHKIVSKAEGALADLDDDDPDGSYRRIIAGEAAAIIRRRGDLVITETRHGFVCANAGVDRSNVTGNRAVLLPADPDRSAHRIRVRLERATGARLGVVITDTFGRAWRRGLVDVAIGVSGLPALLDLRGTTDSQGRELAVTEVAIADEIAAAADLVAGKATGIPVVVVRGLAVPPGEGRAADLVRHPADDFFR
jgi:coenzyme F420-0:L-glutamate ligase/coenzyme F420-1:gamma-L-glutamate ligase